MSSATSSILSWPKLGLGSSFFLPCSQLSGKLPPYFGYFPKLMVTVEAGSNPAPVTVTEVPLGPEIGSRKMTEAAVNVFDADLDPWVALTV